LYAFYFGYNKEIEGYKASVFKVGKGKIKQVTANHSKDNFEYLEKEEIEPVIKTRKNASTKAKGSPARAQKVREVRETGYEGWKDKYKYDKRWMNETTFSRVKGKYGEYITAKSGEIW